MIMTTTRIMRRKTIIMIAIIVAVWLAMEDIPRVPPMELFLV